ncbi:hypothetical protein RclHR1_11230001, partial [Rhizophagus clarus]
ITMLVVVIKITITMLVVVIKITITMLVVVIKITITMLMVVIKIMISISISKRMTTVITIMLLMLERIVWMDLFTYLCQIVLRKEVQRQLHQILASIHQRLGSVQYFFVIR